MKVRININVERAGSIVRNELKKRQYSPVKRLAVPENICSNYTWFLGGFRPFWQEFSEAYHAIHARERVVINESNRTEMYVLDVYDRITLKQMHQHALEHPEVMMGNERLSRFVERGLKVVTARIDSVELPDNGGWIDVAWFLKN